MALKTKFGYIVKKSTFHYMIKTNSNHEKFSRWFLHELSFNYFIKLIFIIFFEAFRGVQEPISPFDYVNL